MNVVKTNLLAADPSFIRGFGRVIDLGSTRDVYNGSSSEDEADYNALMSDWIAVGKDMEHATRELKREIETSDC